MKQVMSIPPLAQHTGISEYAIRKLIADGKLPVLKLSNKWFISLEQFEALFTTEGVEHEG